MGNDFRRDHSFRIPRPDLSVKYNTPNACNSCHKDKDSKWASNSFEKMFGEVDSIHFSEKLIPGVLGKPNAHLGLLELIADENQPEIIRASAVRALSNYNVENFIEQYIKWLEDDTPLVQGTALDVLGERNTSAFISTFLPLLNAKKRAVRIKAFYTLAGLPETEIPLSYIDSYKKVKKEFFTYLETNADFVGSRVKRASYYLKKGNITDAIFEYKSALKIDPRNAQITLMLAQLYYNNQELENAEQTFKKVIELEPDYGETYFSLALLYGELNRDEEAIHQLNKAKQIMPKNIRTYYNLGILYFKVKQFNNAEKVLKQGLEVAPENGDLNYVLAYQYYTNSNLKKALIVAEKLVSLYPQNRQYQSLLNKITQNTIN
jgi:tetratricopeptide (TPR) repeat protein